MNKKAQTALPYEGLIRLIFAVIAIFGVAFITFSFIRLTNESLESYNNLIDMIENIQDGELKSTILTMDKKTVLIGINSNADLIKMTDEINSEDFYVPRPEECKKQDTCICLCRSDWEEGDLDVKGRKYECNGEILCSSLDNINFLSPLFAMELLGVARVVLLI